MKALKFAIENQHWELAAHALVFGLIKAKLQEGKPQDGKEAKPETAGADYILQQGS